MNTQITFNRATKTITVTGMYDMTAESGRNAELARYLHTDERRDSALANLNGLYARAVDAAATNAEMDMDTAEARLAWVVEAIATMTCSDWLNLPDKGHEYDTSDDRLMHLYVDGKLVNHAAEERVANAPRPEKPSIINGRWNGKIYGSSRKGYSIYVDNNKIDLTGDQEIELRAYLDVATTAEKLAKAKAPATPYTVING